MGVNDRRFFACPALIPHVLEKALFAGAFVPSIPRCAASIPREIGSGTTIARVAASARGVDRLRGAREKGALEGAEGELDFRMPDGSSGQPETDS